MCTVSTKACGDSGAQKDRTGVTIRIGRLNSSVVIPILTEADTEEA
jgi:hypothetical protein